MRMLKRLIILIMIFLFPMIVNAQSKYEVEEIKLIGQEGEAVEKEPASFTDGKLNINVKLNNPGDSLKYQLKIKNISNTQYIININTNQLSDEYIKYNVEYGDNNPIINPSETKIIQLSIKMEKDVPPQMLMVNQGVYTDKKTINISLTKDDEVEKNPNTKNDIIIIFLLMLALITLFILVIKHDKMRSLLSVLLIVYLLIPPQIIAIEQIDLIIESEVEINKQDTYTVKQFDSSINDYVYNDYNFAKGMTLGDFAEFNKNHEFPGFFNINEVCGSYTYHDYGYERCMEEIDNPDACIAEHPNGYGYGSGDDYYTAPIMNSQSGYYTFFKCCLSGNTIIETKSKKTKKRKKKKLKDLTYDDLVLVWDFDNGCLEWGEPLWIQEPEEVPFYYELTFDDGTVLEVIGDHKIYNADLDVFVNCIEDNEFEIGSHTINDKNEILTLISKERINKVNYAYNVITKNHINVFANSVLTSWRINNLYSIESKKYQKEHSVARVDLDKDKIPEEYYKYLRLSEIPYNLDGTMKDTQEYIYNLVNRLERNKRK